MPPVTSLTEFAIWLLLGCLAILFSSVAFFVGKSFTDTEKKFKDHGENIDKLYARISDIHNRISKKADSEQIGKLYESQKSEIARFREQELSPLSEKLEQYRSEVHEDMKNIENRTTQAISDLKQEINQQLALIIQLLQKDK